ncbi:hypothetical protein GCM10007079_08140 [Nocardiopsis terrae]|nr:hypothetical protein GCM10007079_08140 [Nocardiopsis terrae]
MDPRATRSVRGEGATPCVRATVILRAFPTPVDNAPNGQVDMATRRFMEVMMDEFRQVVTDDLGH